MTLGIARTTEPLPTRTSEQSLEKRTFEVVVTNELRYASAREMNVITAIPLTSCRRLAGGDDDLGGRDTAADEIETRAERVRCTCHLMSLASTDAALSPPAPVQSTLEVLCGAEWRPFRRISL
jgi:hypothetical protein